MLIIFPLIISERLAKKFVSLLPFYRHLQATNFVRVLCHSVTYGLVCSRRDKWLFLVIHLAECLKKAKGIGFIMNGARLVHKINKRPALAGLFLI